MVEFRFAFPDGLSPARTLLEPLPDESVAGIIARAFDQHRKEQPDVDLSSLSPHPALLRADDADGTQDPVYFMDFFGVNKRGLVHRKDRAELMPWSDFKRALSLRDPAVRDDALLLTCVGGFGGGGDITSIANFLNDLFGTTPAGYNLLRPLRRLLGAPSQPWPNRKVREQARDFVLRGLTSKEEVHNYAVICTRWDAARFGETLGLTKNEAECMLEGLGYEKGDHELWSRPRH